MRSTRKLGAIFDLSVVRKDCRKMGLIIVCAVIISQVLQFGFNSNRGALAFAIGLAMWLFGVFKQQYEVALGESKTTNTGKKDITS